LSHRAILALLAGLAMVTGCASKRVLATDEAPASSPPASVPAPLLMLRVGLAENLDRVVLAGTGPCEVRSGDRRRETLSVAPGQKVTVRRLENKVRWSCGASGGSAESIAVVPIGDDTLIEWKESPWRGAVAVIPTPGGRGLTVVDEVELEAYLRGVVPGEIGRPGAAALAAVEAQAVAARTYAVSHRGTRASRGFDLYADVMDQMYLGVAGEDFTADVAVANTAGLVLVYAGQPINAYYHANCGGCSERPEAVWPRPPEDFLVVCEDKPFAQGECFCAEGRHATWREEWSAVDLARTLRTTLPAYLDYMKETPARSAWAGDAFTPRGGGDGRTPGALRDLRVRERTTSGRVAWLDIETDAGTYHLHGDRVRWVLTPPAGNGSGTILRSAWFELDLQRQGGRLAKVVARGKGFGHGIGMCQHGALARAKAGEDFRAILAHYYPGAEVQVATADTTP
jgi:stage II sporulation protein D